MWFEVCLETYKRLRRPSTKGDMKMVIDISQPEAAETTEPVASSDASYRKFVNPEWVRLLGLLGMNVKYRRCLGTELHTEDGRVLLDYLSGYCVHNTGHNHPYIVQALIEELSQSGPAMLQSHVVYTAGTLAER